MLGPIVSLIGAYVVASLNSKGAVRAAVAEKTLPPYEQLADRVAELEATAKATDALITDLRREASQLREQIGQLKAENAQLRRENQQLRSKLERLQLAATTEE